MTLVIACLSKDGLVLAADSKAVEDPDKNADRIHVYDDTDKIIELGPTCAALVYGHGTDDYNQLFDVFKEETKYDKQYKGYIDYDYCRRNLAEFLVFAYGNKLPANTERTVSVMIAGVDPDGAFKITDFTSNRSPGLFFPLDIGTFYYGGKKKIAHTYFTKHGNEIIRQNSEQVISKLEGLIEQTADLYPDEVNKNIMRKLITENDIIDLGRKYPPNSKSSR